MTAITDPQAVIPLATYRLQLHGQFGFEAARAILPYLQRLGISHVYCSPIAQARAGSMHGYDVVDHTRINPELGGADGFQRFASEARSLGLGLLLDQVPNHMGVFGTDNPWWMDVLQNGRASEFARYFDIDWDPPNAALRGKLLVPVLGDSYGSVLDSGAIELVLDVSAGALALRYHEHRLPLDPNSYPLVLRAAAQDDTRFDASVQELRGLADVFDAVPARDAPHTQPLARASIAHAAQARLARALTDQPGLRDALERVVARLNSAPARDELDALHEAQAFRLSHWRLAADEINYRRFFDVNELAAVRVEEARVFEAVQGAALDLAATGAVDGLRIDHPDGLLDPAAYFSRLQEGFARRKNATEDPLDSGSDSRESGARKTNPRPLYVVVEKIIAPHEELPTEWAVHGTTGYDFAVLVNGLLLERRNGKRMERTWRSFTGAVDASTDYPEIVYQCKRMIARGALASQLTVLAQAAERIALADRHTRDYGFNSLRDALAEVAAAMPVYRTYVVDAVSAQDRRFLDWAFSHARRRSGSDDAGLFDFLQACLLVRPAAGAPAGMSDAMRDFALRFQQFCAPVAAKGVEDTAFYRYYRLASLNDVGGDPGQFGVAAPSFHKANAARAARWPHTLLATSTHDNKRAEDVRNRINVLSEMPGAWRLAQRRWRISTRRWRAEVEGALAPSAADQSLLHQTLLGTLPAAGLTAEELDRYRERIENYMRKAAREAKLQTSWARPNAAYETALQGFVGGLLARVDNNPVLTDLQARAAEIAWFGALNSLVVTLLKFTCPGVPDVYQGNELPDFSLVDPDNRRPVDYALRERMLGELEHALDAEDRATRLAAWASHPASGHIKLWLVWRLLALRRQEPRLFSHGQYIALKLQGAQRRHAVAYARRLGDKTLLVVAGRRFVGLQSEPGKLPLGTTAWTDTRVLLPDDLSAASAGLDVLAQRPWQANGESILLADVCGTLPFAAILVQT
ncbi:MAG: malto-oligosyltrehalose synthase [Burkholderiaceae bacterium]